MKAADDAQQQRHLQEQRLDEEEVQKKRLRRAPAGAAVARGVRPQAHGRARAATWMARAVQLRVYAMRCMLDRSASSSFSYRTRAARADARSLQRHSQALPQSKATTRRGRTTQGGRDGDASRGERATRRF